MSCCTLCASNGDLVSHNDDKFHCDECFKNRQNKFCPNCKNHINFWININSFNEMNCCVVCAANGEFKNVPCKQHCDQCILSTMTDTLKECTGCRGIVNFFVRPKIQLPPVQQYLGIECTICKSNGEIRFNCKIPHCPDCYDYQMEGKKRCTNCKSRLNTQPFSKKN